MSNLAVFNNLLRRAQTKSDNTVSLLENVPITTNVSVVLFAGRHVRALETKLAAQERELVELRALVSQAVKL